MIVYIKTAVFVTLLFTACNNPREKDAVIHVPSIPIIQYSVTATFPHDTSLFTEGLLVHEGKLFESTGSPEEEQHLESLIGILDLTTGKIQGKVKLDKTKYFGEGIVILNGKIYQLTYKNKIAFIYDAKSFKLIGKFNYKNAEGWGLTTNGVEIIMSDGSEKLFFLKPEDFTPTKVIVVTDNGVPVTQLNELEYINGYIYANIWTTNNIVKIDPDTGRVVGKLDLTPLQQEAISINTNADVLNGIAYDSTTDKIYVTGKLWPKVYQLSFPH